MYLIANMTSKKVHIQDMNLYVDQKQVIDLHRLRLKLDPSDSKDLKQYVRKGTIRELNKPGRKPAPPPQPPKPKKADNKKLVEDIKRIIVSELDKRDNKKVAVQPTRDGSDDVLAALSEITSQINVIKEQGISVVKLDDFQEEDTPIKELDEEKLADIHARAVDKMTKDTTRSVNYQEKDIEDPSLLDHASELEDLL